MNFPTAVEIPTIREQKLQMQKGFFSSAFQRPDKGQWKLFQLSNSVMKVTMINDHMLNLLKASFYQGSLKQLM